MEGKPLDRESGGETAAAHEKPASPQSDATSVATNEAPASAAEPKPGEAPAETAAPAPKAAAASALPPDEHERMMGEIVAALKTVYDPEIPADIYELGLIYDVAIDGERNVSIMMTLTAPGCPVAGEMPGWVENAVNAVPGVAGTTVTMTFDPPWDMGRMSDEARLALNMF